MKTERLIVIAITVVVATLILQQNRNLKECQAQLAHVSSAEYKLWMDNHPTTEEDYSDENN